MSKWKLKSLELCTVCHCFAHLILIERGGQVSYYFSFFMYVVLYVHSSFRSVRALTLELLSASRTLLKTEQANYANWSTTTVSYIAKTSESSVHIPCYKLPLPFHVLSFLCLFHPPLSFMTRCLSAIIYVFNAGLSPKGHWNWKEICTHYTVTTTVIQHWGGQWWEPVLYIYIKWTNTVFSRAHLMLNSKILQCASDDEMKT